MCKHDMHAFLRALPKCEHHIHLEGCLSPAILFHLAKKNSIALPDPALRPEYTSVKTLEQRYEKFESLQDFLDCHYLAMSVLMDAADFEMLAWTYYENAHADGVHHAEAFFDPQSHTTRGIPLETVVQGYEAAGRRAEAEFGMSTSLILCFLRHLPVESANETLQAAASSGVFSKDSSVIAVGLDSSEVPFPPHLFQDPYKQAKNLGIHRTAHAGEEGDPSYIRQALDLLDCERIDHGLRLAEDADLMREVASRKILCTLCPLSNVYLRCVDKIADLPIRRFLDAGVPFSLNSDDPAYFGGYILNNYCAVQEAFNLSVEEWRSIARASIEGSWISQERRSTLFQLVDDCIAKHT